MLRHPLSTLLPLLAATLPAQVQAVSPTDRADLEGSSFTHLPIGRADARMQTLHADVPGGLLLTGHAYRRDAAQVRGQVQGFVSDLQVTLSMSALTPTTASTAFANNAGPNPVVALPRTLVGFPATQRPALDPSPTFDLVIPYQVPFLVPATGGTLCVDVEVFGNQTATAANTNLSLYLDAHENYTDGRAEQPGFRTGTGCAAPGHTTTATATLTFWRLTGGTRIDVALRDGVPDSGGGSSRAFLTLGNSQTSGFWPGRPDCTFASSTEVWFALPGALDANGDLDTSLLNLPLLPPGYRLWAQVGSIDLNTFGMAFSDASTFVTPPSGPLPIATCRIVNSNDHTAATGTVSYAVPVMAFL